MSYPRSLTLGCGDCSSCQPSTSLGACPPAEQRDVLADVIIDPIAPPLTQCHPIALLLLGLFVGALLHDGRR